MKAIETGFIEKLNWPDSPQVISSKAFPQSQPFKYLSHMYVCMFAWIMIRYQLGIFGNWAKMTPETVWLGLGSETTCLERPKEKREGERESKQAWTVHVASSNIPVQLFCGHPLLACTGDRAISVCYFLITRGGRKNPDDGLEGAIALLFFPLPSFADYVSRAPLLADDKQNFHVLCIINPSLPLFMPTRPLSPAHAWIAKESALQLELIDILRKKKGEKGEKTENP